MKDKGIKMYRLTFSAGLLLAVGGLWSCQDELLTGQPDWLGSSIYEELEKRGNFSTTLALINDEDVSPKDVNGETANARTLRLTGSKTLFVANDDAYKAFFKSNPWGVRRYEDLTVAQKKLLFNSSVVNQAYLIELMSNIASETAEPEAGACMRRSTNSVIYDSVPKLTAKDMPDNEYWAKYRLQYPDGGDRKMTVMRDDNPVLMNHFLPAFMQSKGITDEDLAFLTNGICQDNEEAYVNGRHVMTRDVTCQNGYIQILDSVPTPLNTMAEMIRNDKELSTFSSLLDRFSVPVYAGSDATKKYNDATGDDVDSLFVWRYFNDGFGSDTEGNNNAYFTYNGTRINDVLPYDPGWNAYADGVQGAPKEKDMAVIIAPTNAAFDRYFAGPGASLYARYNEDVNEIPNNVVVEILNEFMRNSVIQTVPSKFGSVNNSAQNNLGLDKGVVGGETGVFACVMSSNGVVYKSNEVYSVPAFSSVYLPTLIFENLKIMNWAINEYGYDAWLKSMDSEYMFIIPSVQALQNYVDPVDYQKTQKTLTEFYFDESQGKVRCRRYNAVDDGNGGLTRASETPISDPWKNVATTDGVDAEDDYVENRLLDILENCIIVKDSIDPGRGKELWTTKGGMPIVIENPGKDVKIYTPYQKEIAGDGEWEAMEAAETDGFFDYGKNPGGNGLAFIVEKEAPMSASKSVMTILNELNDDDNRYQEFYDILAYLSSEGRLLQENYDFKTASSDPNAANVSRTVSNGLTFNIMNNFNYTVYVPCSEEIEKLYQYNILPDWEKALELSEKLEDMSLSPGEYDEIEAERDSMNVLLENFVRYHVQNNAVYLNAHAVKDGDYESSLLLNGRFATLSLSGTGNTNSYQVICRDGSGNAVTQTPRTIIDGNYFAREYRFRAGVKAHDGKETSAQITCSDITRATRIYNSSTAVIHLIDKPLLYTEKMCEAYENEQNYQP